MSEIQNTNLIPPSPQIDVNSLKPFTRFCCSIGAIPTSYLASMSYEEQLLWLCDYLENTVIPTINNNGNAVAELQGLYIELKNYVDNYFTNLDVQQEINNKLDTMAEDGTLSTLLEPFLNDFQQQINVQNNKIENIENKVQSATNGTPLPATSTQEMTDTSKIYVNTSDGNWYYYNGTSWQIGGVYQGVDLDQYYKNILFNAQAEILTDKEVPSINGYVTSAGIFNDTSSAKRTDYVPINDFDTIEYKSYLSSSGYEIAFFDSDKTIIKNISILGDENKNIKTISIPKNAYYVMLSMYEQNDFKPEDSYIELYKQDSIKSKLDSLFNDNYNIFDELDDIKANITEINEKPSISGYVTSAGIFNNTSQAKRTDYIDITGFDTIEYRSYLTSSGYEIAFYDDNKKILKSISILGDENTSSKKVSIPETAKYVILSMYSAYDFTPEKSFIHIYKENSLINQINNFSYNSILKNKQILVFGDSITDCCNFNINFENNTTNSYSFKNPSNSFQNEEGETVNYSMWAKLLKEICEPLEIRNYAKSGARIKTFVTEENTDNLRQNLSYQVQLALNDLNNPNNAFDVDNFVPDIIIFAIGTNDDATPNDTYETAMQKTIESNGFINVQQTLDNLDTNYFNQSLRYNLLKLKNKFPYAQIFFVLPLQKQATRNLDEQKISDIKKMCDTYSVNIIDGAKNTGIITDLAENKDIYFKDGLHPNDKGQNLLTRTIIKSLENNYMDFSNMNP